MGMLTKLERLEVESDLAVQAKVQKRFEQFCSKHISVMFSSTRQFHQLNLALAEGFSNAVRHAHKELPSETIIEIELAIRDKRIEIRIWDRGKPFNPDLIEEPLPGTLCEGGYGWFLLRRLAERVVYERCQDGRNCLLISSSL
ncbi:MAG: anti-sigma regulatory factor [Coleofasciculus sp. S288]|nr:anti-sigma regulatory factor [Coleofasciculus sp. S288]